MELIKKLKSLELYLSAHPDNEEHSECRDRLEDVVEMKKYLEKFEWIDVRDRLPKDEKNNSIPCLVMDSYSGAVVRVFNQHHNCWDDEDMDDYYTNAIGGKISHWMKLPKKP